ncbi:MAG: heme-copper oxidase subunit III [Chloroflexi bacterium]|nr:heme-copper oxidase subunit III [Chloroflexota bacterium]
MAAESRVHQEAGGRYALLGVGLFILTEAVLFGALFAAYFTIRHHHGGHWAPPTGGQLEAIPLPLALTVILLTSSATLQWAVASIRGGDSRGLVAGLALTALLGGLFLLGQGREFATLGFTPQSGVYGATFFVLVGFHGAHVLGGVVFLLVLLARSLLGQFSPSHHTAVEAGSLYWHFVDAVWLGLFTILYLLPG